jgi:DNA-binding CsgD family transcriptional regulator
MNSALLGRDGQRAQLERLIDGVRHGRGAAIVVHGDAGVGKTALLRHTVSGASDLPLLQTAGVESERSLPFAALHQLCRPLLQRVEQLPTPQRDALATAFGREAESPPDPILVGSAVLNLLRESAAADPKLCVVDDAQWLDPASAEALGAAARRVSGESVLVVFATREVDHHLRKLPTLAVSGLDPVSARRLLESLVAWPVDERVLERIIAETGGNPLALLDVSRELRAGGFEVGFGGRTRQQQPRQSRLDVSHSIDALPDEVRLLLLIASAEPAGDPLMLRRAGALLGVQPAAYAQAASSGLIEIGEKVLFAHALVRSAVYAAAAPNDRQRVHGGLAAVVDAGADPDRRAWHLAQAAVAPDEHIAVELEEAADYVRGRGGIAASAALLERAVELSQDPARRIRRALAAARAKHLAGAPEAGLRLVSTAQAGPLTQLERADSELLRVEIAYSQDRGSDGPGALLKAAQTIAPLDAGTAHQAYLDAFWATNLAGRFAQGVDLHATARAARATAVEPAPGGASDLVLDGLAAATIDGYPAAVPALKRAVRAFRDRTVSREEELHRLWQACVVALDLWDDESHDILATRFVELSRATGALAVLPVALSARIVADVFAGRLTVAAARLEDLEQVSDAAGTRFPPYAAGLLAGWRGRQDDTAEFIGDIVLEATQRGEGLGVAVAEYARAVLFNGLGQYSIALEAADASDLPDAESFTAVNMSLVELIEAAARSGHPERAASACSRLSEMCVASGTEWALGNRARSLALLSTGATAESLYQEAIEHFARTRIRGQLARSHLLYGEWLRRASRRVDARAQLQTAHRMLTAIGAEAFAERARRELEATGEKVRARSVETHGELTAQESEIAHLVAGGKTNHEVGGELFISPRTVEWHLRKTYPKLGISSRKQLTAALRRHSAHAQH